MCHTKNEVAANSFRKQLKFLRLQSKVHLAFKNYGETQN